MWIAKLNIGIKKVLVVMMLLLLATTLAHRQSFALFYLFTGITISWATLIVYLICVYGLIRRVYRFTDAGVQKEVQDYLHPLHTNLNYRGIFHINTIDTKPSWDSRVYTKNTHTWAYFDILRRVLATVPKQSLHNILIIGAGGGALSQTISRTYPTAHIDMIEPSSVMIWVTNKFFLPISHPQLTWHKQYAESFVKQTTTKTQHYDCIALDMFTGTTLSKTIYSRSFVRHLHSLTHKHTILFINLGYKHINISNISSLYTRNFPQFTLYQYGNSIIAFNRNIHNDQALRLERIHL